MFKAIAASTIGAGFLIVAALTAQSTREFIRSSIVVPVHVVKLNAGGSHPQVEFVTKAGERISYPQGGMIYGMKMGEQVSVRYLPDSPSRSATIDQFGAVWNWTITTVIIGVGAIVAGLMNLPSRR